MSCNLRHAMVLCALFVLADCAAAEPIVIISSNPRPSLNESFNKHWPKRMPGMSLTLGYANDDKDVEEAYVNFIFWRKYFADPFTRNATTMGFEGGVIHVRKGDVFTLINGEVRVVELRGDREIKLEVLKSDHVVEFAKRNGKGFYLCEDSSLKDVLRGLWIKSVHVNDANPEDRTVELEYSKTFPEGDKVSPARVGHIIPMSSFKLMITDIHPGNPDEKRRGWIALEPVLPVETRLPE